MTVSEFASLVGLTPYTLRYYEKIGLLKQVKRNASGHRYYTNKDVDWVGFIVRLKATGMPLEKILEYAKKKKKGSSTLLQRQQLLEHHKNHLYSFIEEQKRHLLALEDKITLYKTGKVH